MLLNLGFFWSYSLIEHYSYPIIKRRIAWLIGKWISDMCAPANDPNVWELLVHLLRDRGPGTDSVVRLTAAAALRECIDVRLFYMFANSLFFTSPCFM